MITNQTTVFNCNLDGQPDHLTTQRSLRNYRCEELTGLPLFLNKSCKFGKLPELTDHSGYNAFDDTEHTAWVRDSVTDVLQPFWLGAQLRSVLEEAETGKPIPSLDENQRQALALAGILVPENHESQREKALAKLSRCAEQVKERGYAPIAGLIHPFHISALRRYYRDLIQSGNVVLGDTQSARRYCSHNEPVACFFHRQLASAMSTIVGEPVKPSYVYFASYLGGAVLEKHTDRSQCEFSMTMCLDYSPEPRTHTPWPIKVHNPNGTTTVYQALGDALVYRGCEVPHSRDMLPWGHTSTSLFFHYVPKSFTGSLD